MFFLSLGLPTTSFSAESMDPAYFQKSYDMEESQIPKKPTAPPPLLQKTPTQIPHCERHFLFKGKKIECDSEMGQDGIRLGRVIGDLPYSQSELSLYRENLQKIRIAGFTGTLGIIAAIGGVFFSHPVLDPTTGSLRPGGIVTLAGIILTANSLIYGLSMMKANEVHIDNAVQHYNRVHPNQPIELEFSTHIDF